MRFFKVHNSVQNDGMLVQLHISGGVIHAISKVPVPLVVLLFL